MAGSRRFVRVLQLLAEHPLARVSQAVETCVREQLYSAEAVIQRTRALAAIEAADPRRRAGSQRPIRPRLRSRCRCPT